jgi:hypothetical protein
MQGILQSTPPPPPQLMKRPQGVKRRGIRRPEGQRASASIRSHGVTYVTTRTEQDGARTKKQDTGGAEATDSNESEDVGGDACGNEVVEGEVAVVPCEVQQRKRQAQHCTHNVCAGDRDIASAAAVTGALLIREFHKPGRDGECGQRRLERLQYLHRSCSSS